MHLPTSFRFDIISFGLGFIIASLFWFLISRLKSVIPQIKELAEAWLENRRQQRLATTETAWLQIVLRQAQHAHLAQSLFPLDEILVEPSFIAPPTYLTNPHHYNENQAAPEYTIPYTPDWPELPSRLGVQRLSIQDLIDTGVPIALIGQPGSGKTITLSTIASRMARRQIKSNQSAPPVPIFLHVADLRFPVTPSQDPLDTLVLTFSTLMAKISSKKLNVFIRSTLKRGRFFLLLDGLDELHPESIKPIVQYITALLRKYPGIRVIVAASSNALDGLVDLGFFPVSLASWTPVENQRLLSNWYTAWNSTVQGQNNKNENEAPSAQPDLLFLKGWLRNVREFLTPFEWSLIIWGALAGDLKGYSPIEALECYINRLCTPENRNSLDGIAHNLIENKKSFLDRANLPFFSVNLKEPVSSNSSITGKDSNKSGRSRSSSSGRAIPELLENHLLVDRGSGNLSLVHAILTSYLASFHQTEENLPSPEEILTWEPLQQSVGFFAARQKEQSWVSQFLVEDDPILHKRIQIVARWLRLVPVDTAWRTSVLSEMAGMIYQSTIPFLIRFRLLSGFVLSEDPSLPTLFKQMAADHSSDIIKLGSWGLGALRISRFADNLVDLCNHSDEEVRVAACLALGAIGNQKAMEGLANLLLNADELMRQTAAEIFARLGTDGHEVLKDALTVDDILTRRAAVYGLLRVREEWARTALEKTSIQDAQWVVRNVAGQALEDISKPLPCIPQVLPPVWEASWIITFASKQGLGLIPNENGAEMLLSALQSGTQEEKLHAIQYLIQIADEGITKNLYELAAYSESILSASAFYALWLIDAGNKPLPSLTKYGLV